MDINEIILRFFRNDVGGILVMKPDGEVLYEDGRAARIDRANTNWKIACPPPRDGQKAEVWDLLESGGGRTYMVLTSTFGKGDDAVQIHHFVDNSVYTDLYRDINSYSRMLKEESERDGLTGLLNKGKFLELKQSLFPGKSSITVFNMDLNFLKQTNDTLGHEAGDKLILKAAESLRMIEARNVMAFRVGGDEFLVVALHLSEKEALELREKWEQGLAELNRKDDGIECVIACGMAYGAEGYDLEEVLATADRLMYADKKAKKGGR